MICKRFSKPTDTPFEDIFDADVEELTLEKKQNISKFIATGQIEIKGIMSNTIIDITDITILDIMNYLKQTNESPDDSKFINPYKGNPELEEKTLMYTFLQKFFI